MKREDFNIIQHTRKPFLYNKEIPWQKKNTNLFDAAMGAYDGAEVCEIVGLFLLNNLANKFDKNSFGLYRDDVLVRHGHRAGKMRKEFHQLFKEERLSLEIDCNLKTVNYLDITLDLNTSTHKPYRKPKATLLELYFLLNNDNMNIPTSSQISAPS